MTYHISLRLAWHDNGWNGHICREPKANSYCVGEYSYPGDLIATGRHVDQEDELRNQHCAQVYKKAGLILPCCYSINAFGKEEITAVSAPPEFFNDATQSRIWKMPPATASTWPYEEMYKDEIKNPEGTYNYQKRLEAAREFFAKLEPLRTLIFYYANFSNPFSENEKNRYVLLGVSRLRAVGDELFYEGCSPQTITKYAGGFIWQRNITSCYPDLGFVIPYHTYIDNQEVLNQIAISPENQRNFKYATRHISDDDSLELIERLIEVTNILKEANDTSEKWDDRISWLNSLIAELWSSRGAYPGLPRVLDYLGFSDAVIFYKNTVSLQPAIEHQAKDNLFDLIDSKSEQVKDLKIDSSKLKSVRRQWQLKSDIQRKCLQEVLPRFDLSKEQIDRILGDEKEDFSIYSSLEEITDNPYIMFEEYIGNDPDDHISFNRIDHGILPSPDLGLDNYQDFAKDDGKRLRALCVEQLRNNVEHTFLPANLAINKINHWLSYLPDWKKGDFNIRYFDVDKAILSGALTIRKNKEGRQYIYLNANFEYEREIEKQIRNLAKRSDIALKSPITNEHWRNFLHDSDSPILKKDPATYDQVLKDQGETCSKIFRKAVSVILGGAGTGKTTLIKAIMQAVEKAHGAGTPILILAPTGKATERIREITERPARTIHSFLAGTGWLNDNLTFKLDSGKKQDISVLIIDESSMLDLSLLGTLFKAINWGSVKSLIFVGDPNQLPPIGTGKVFADIMEWLQANFPENVAALKTNVRQLLNKIEDKGTGILEMASLYVNKKCEQFKDSETRLQQDTFLQRVQEGEDIDKDLRVILWNGLDDLQAKLTGLIISDLEDITKTRRNSRKPFELWSQAYNIRQYENQRPDLLQVISPYRGEYFGVNNLNLKIQSAFNEEHLKGKGAIAGITLFDKVIQFVNRTKSNPIKAYNTETKKIDKIEVFNGEIGFVIPHGYDNKKWWHSDFVLSRFQVVFKRKNKLWAEYARSDVENNLELAYAISVHKAQGSEFEKVYFILPKHKRALVTRELFYTGLTRATSHCTILIEEDISPLLYLLRLENSQLVRINSSLFEFEPVPDEMLSMSAWYEEGKIHMTLADRMVQSKSEVIIANMLTERNIDFRYDVPLYADDGTMYRPDFVIKWEGEDWYWEHLGMLRGKKYKRHWVTKQEWYKKHGFSDRLIVTNELHGIDSKVIKEIIGKHFSTQL